MKNEKSKNPPSAYSATLVSPRGDGRGWGKKTGMFVYQKSFTQPTAPVDEEQFYALVRAKVWNDAIDRFRQTGDQSIKRRLPAFIFQATFDETESKTGKRGCWRKQAATRLTGLVVMDIDHVDNPREAFSHWPTVKDLGILLIYITPSGHGLKIVFKANGEWGNLIDNQHRMAELLGVEVDESCKDASRMSFICKESDILFLDKELFTYENKAYGEKYDEDYRAGKSKGMAPLAAPPYRAESTEQACAEKVPVKWKGFDVQSIIDARYADKLPCATDSNRHHESLKLASDLLLMLDGDKQTVLKVLKAQPWVKEIIAERGENVEQTVASAADRMSEREKKYSSPLPSKAMQAAIEKATGRTYNDLYAQHSTPLPNEEAREGLGGEASLPLSAWGDAIASLSAHFPLLADICKGLKPAQYPAALFVGGGLLMTLMTRCSYRFYHRPEELRRLNNSTIIIGDPASGKSFATRLYRLLTGPIEEADRVGKDAINAYREQMRTKGANKEKPKRPKAVIRIHPARTSNAQFIQDMVNSVENVDGEQMQLHMLTFDTELDNTLSVQKGGSWIDKQTMELKAFHNEEDGQAYSNNDSIFQNFQVTWNYIYTGTPIALKKKVNAQNFGSGLATRLTCIPLPATNFEMMTRERTLDPESDERLRVWAMKLDKTKGVLPLDTIVDELYEWTTRRMADAKENDSRADEMLLKRCAYHGINFAAPFIVMRHWQEVREDGIFWSVDATDADGQPLIKTDAVDWQLAELITNIQYACQRHYFGTLAEDYFEGKLKEASVNVRRKQKTIEAFERLPMEFTTEDVMRCFGLNKDAAARLRIFRLVKDHLIEKAGDFTERGTLKARYRKTGVMMN